MVTTHGQTSKATVWEFWRRLAGATPDSVADIVRAFVHDDVSWHGPHPLDDLAGADALIAGFWRPLLHSFPGLRRETDVFFAGECDGTEWVAGTGYFTGVFAHDWLGIPPTGKPLHIRFGEFCRIDGGKITAVYLLLDLIDVMLQAGVRVLPPSNGDEAKAPAPRMGDGVLLVPQDGNETRRSLALVEAMLASMGQYDLNNPATLSHPSFWRQDMCWYGPCGIGTARDMERYIPVHQRPFLEAFPDREIADHAALFAEATYIAVVGWPDVVGTHRGAWLGCPPTGLRVGMRVMDFWRREGELLAENWVLIDIPDIFRQCGVDLFARLAERVGENGATSS